jgi:hypothetical protein
MARKSGGPREAFFLAYREHEARRVDVNNSMMALLAGSQLATHLLHLSKGSSRLLPEIYPSVPHIGRFNLTSEAANKILTAADIHLGAMAVPYTLGLHEDFMRTCLAILKRSGAVSGSAIRATSLAGYHDLIAATAGGSFDTVSREQLSVLRLMRNCVIHAGGRASPELATALSTWTPEAEKTWVDLAGRNPSGLRKGDRVLLGHAEMVIALAVTKRLDRNANELLQRGVTRDVWSDLVVEDALVTEPRLLSTADSLRKIRGLARRHYGVLSLTDDELRDAVGRAA